MIEQLLDDLAPWYELWRDMAGLYTTRLYEKLKEIWLSLGGEPVPLPVFLRACGQRGIPINGTGGTGLLPGLDEEIQVAWQKQLGDRWTQPVLKMTGEDTAFLRSHFQFRRMKAFDNMAPDLQNLRSRCRITLERELEPVTGGNPSRLYQMAALLSRLVS